MITCQFQSKYQADSNSTRDFLLRFGVDFWPIMQKYLWMIENSSEELGDNREGIASLAAF